MSLKQAVALRARRFLDEHFSTDAGGCGAETEGVLKLRYGSQPEACVPDHLTGVGFRGRTQQPLQVLVLRS